MVLLGLILTINFTSGKFELNYSNSSEIIKLEKLLKDYKNEK